MSPWLANELGLAFVFVLVALAGLALYWRVGSWWISPAASLTFDEGLRIGSKAPNLVGSTDNYDIDISWVGGRLSFVAFGKAGCQPCGELLAAAPDHPATRHMRLIYMTDEPGQEVDLSGAWEIYRFHDEGRQRALWRAPVSPYFHVIDPQGRIAEKGVANLGEHLDRLLTVLPPAVSPAISFSTGPIQEGGAFDG